ncbi:MAG: hypothetical protein HC886_00380 [Leptolyngbyaceae cyanobacterium SM1_1_3]|nr:hypothetical protein [Leptolyngbyaceae cyanobacterium SM1_1_3]NJN03969.1 hypothetical protein [Leptolyngbyaceae cyanobacterium RM1_1_2]NJO09075.1 hypothetical protein [Leptolyngbyaceae cyanobacterium SL_1_1]
MACAVAEARTAQQRILSIYFELIHKNKTGITLYLFVQILSVLFGWLTDKTLEPVIVL